MSSNNNLFLDKRSIMQVLGCLVNHPNLFDRSDKYTFNVDDFGENFYKIIFGAVIDESLGDEVKVTVIATGFKKGSETKTEISRQAMNTAYPEAFTKATEDRAVRRAFEKKSEPEEELELVPKTKEEEEFDIPAFLRKKLKNR